MHYVIVAAILIAIGILPSTASAQWSMRIDAGLVQANGVVEPSSANLDEASRSGLALGAAIEYLIDRHWSLSIDAAWHERGVLRYFREQLVEEHRYRCIDFGPVLRWMPLEGRLRPFMFAGVGVSMLIESLVQFGFHERYNSLEGTEGMRRLTPNVQLGLGARMDFGSGLTLGAECAWEPLLADLYLSETEAGRSFRARDVLITFSLLFPISTP